MFFKKHFWGVMDSEIIFLFDGFSKKLNDLTIQTKPVQEGIKLINSSELVGIDQAEVDDHLSKSDQDLTKPQLRDTRYGSILY